MTKNLPAGLRIRDLRVSRGWTQEDLADKLGTTKATISKIERSTMSLSESWLIRFGNVFGITASSILSDAPPAASVRQVPLVGRIAAGNWREAVQEPLGYVAAMNVTDQAFALTPVGDSMDQVVPEGAHVIVEPNDPTLRDGKIYAVMNEDGETTVKMYRSEPARLTPMSSNPVHQPMMLGQAPFTVIGRVVSIVLEV